MLILLAAAGHQLGRLLPDSALAGLFVIIAVGLIAGPGYTRYKIELCTGTTSCVKAWQQQVDGTHP